MLENGANIRVMLPRLLAGWTFGLQVNVKNTPAAKRLPPEPSAMPQRLIPAIQRASHQIGNSIAAVKGLDVNPSEAHILAHLEFHGATSIDGLHKALGMHHSTLTSVLKRLSVRRLITRRVNPEDRRSFVVNLTAKGHGLARRVVDVLSAICATVLSGVSSATRDEFVRVLQRF